MRHPTAARLLTIGLALIIAFALGGAAMAAAEEGGGGMHAGQIIAIAIGIAGALLLVGLSAGYILPKPPKF